MAAVIEIGLGDVVGEVSVYGMANADPGDLLFDPTSGDLLLEAGEETERMVTGEVRYPCVEQGRSRRARPGRWVVTRLTQAVESLLPKREKLS